MEWSRGVPWFLACALAAACTPDNRPPVLTRPADVTIAAEQSITIAVAAVELDEADSALVTVVDPPPWATLSAAKLELAPGREHVGEHFVKLKATDTKGLSSEVTFVVTVTAGSNRAPALQALEPVTVDEGKSASVTVSLSDPDQGDTVTLTLAGTVPEFVSLEGHSLTFSPGLSDAGVYRIEVRAIDAGGLSASQVITVTVANVDQPPVLAAAADVRVDEGTAATVVPAVSDPDGDAITLELASLPAWAKVVSDGRAILLTPGFEDAGRHAGTVRAKAGGKQVERPFVIEVANVNRGPVIAPIADVELVGGTSREIALVATDADADALVWSGEGLPGWATVAATGTLTLTPPGPTDGVFTIALVATDPAGANDRKSIQAKVSARQTPPELSELTQTEESPVEAGAAVRRPPSVSALVADEQGDAARLEVEVRRADEDYRDEPTLVGTMAPPGVHTIELPNMPVGAWKWRVRAVDATSRASDWYDFGGGGSAFDLLPASLAGRLVIDDGAYARSRMLAVTLEVTPVAGAQLSTMRFSENGLAFNPEREFSAKAFVVVGAQAGPLRLRAQVQDTFGNVGEFEAETLFDDVPPSGAIAFSGTATPELTSQRTVTLDSGVTDAGSGLAEACFSADSFAFTSDDCGAPAAKREWPLSGADGLKTVYARFSDRAGNVLYVQRSIVLDTKAPVGWLVPASSKSVTSSRDLPLLLSASDANGLARVCVAEDDGAFVSENCFDYTPTVTWKLQGDEGQRTVKARVRDLAGNEVVFSASILLDLTRPSLSMNVVGVDVEGTRYVRAAPVELRLTGSDPGVPSTGSGLAGIEFSHDGRGWLPGEPIAATKMWQPTEGDGPKSVYARLPDLAGNVSDVASARYVLDTVPPAASPSALLIKNGDAYTATARVELTFDDVSDATSGLYEIEIWNEPATSGTRIPFVPKIDWDLTAGNGPKTVVARLYDRAGNSSVMSDSIVLDSTIASVSASISPSPSREGQVSLTYTVKLPTGSSPLSQICARNDPSASWDCSLPLTAGDSGSKTVTWALSSTTDGAKTVYLEVRRTSGAPAPTTASVLLDTAAPVVSSFTIGDGSAATKAPTAELRYATTGPETSPLKEWCVSETKFPCTSFTALPASGFPSYALGTEGSKSLTLSLRDAAGNVSTPDARASATVLVDRTAPTFTFDVNGGATHTNSPSVAVTLKSWNDGTGSGPATIEILQDGAAPNPVKVDFTVGSVDYRLVGAEGSRTITVRLTDKAGNTSEKTASIILDQTPPIGTISMVPDVTIGKTKWTNEYTATANITISEPGLYCLADSRPADAAGCTAISGIATPTLRVNPPPPTPPTQGPVTFSVWFFDAAGNVSATNATDTLHVDTMGPAMRAITYSTGHREVYATWEGAYDEGCGVSTYALGVSVSSAGPFTYNPNLSSTTRTDTLVGLSNTLTFHARLRATDCLGNVTESTPVAVRPRFPWDFHQRVPTSEDFLGLAQPAPTAILAVGRRGVAFRTTNAWASYARMDLGADVDFFDVAFADTSRGVAVGAKGVVSVTSDGGLSWHPRTIGPSSITKVRLLWTDAAGDHYIATSFGRVYMGTISKYDGSETWTSSTSGLPVGTIESLATCPRSFCTTTSKGVAVLAVGNYGVYRSQDGGASFSAAKSQPSGTVRALTRATGEQNTYFAFTSESEIWKSTDGGLTWTDIATLPANSGMGNPVAIFAPTTSKVFLGGGLTTGRIAEHPAPGCTINCSTSFKYTDLDNSRGPVNAGNAFSGTVLSAVGGGGGIYTYGITAAGTWASSMRERAYGATGVSLAPNAAWIADTGVIRQPRPTPSYSRAPFAREADVELRMTGVAARDDTTAYLAGWTLVSGAPQSRLYKAVFDPAANKVTLSNETGAAATPNKLYGIGCSRSAAFCIAVGEAERASYWLGSSWVAGSSNTGATHMAVQAWHEGTVPTALAVGFNDTSRAGMVTRLTYASGRLQSQLVNLALSARALYGVAVSGRTYVAVGAFGELIRSGDGGQTWTRRTSTTSSSLNAVTAAGGGLWFAAGDSGVTLRSTDDGVTWGAIESLTTVPRRGIAAAGQEVWSVGDGASILLSTTGGL